ncbi:hypothetical protein EBB07_04890 [Paenibacillaceae bacterium]|nr:hypothetical protein EBB07_04890 [Paenibacillaceae bacterium]
MVKGRKLTIGAVILIACIISIVVRNLEPDVPEVSKLAEINMNAMKAAENAPYDDLEDAPTDAPTDAPVAAPNDDPTNAPAAGDAIALSEIQESLAKSIAHSRMAEAVDEWYSAPHGPISFDGEFGLIAADEIDPPLNMADLLAQVHDMYKGTAPFTKLRAAAIEYYAMQEPVAGQIASIAKPFPIPVISDEENQDVRIVSMKESYTAFKEFVELAVQLQSKGEQ